MIKEMLSEGSKISSKRVITFLGALMLFVCVMVELFTEKEVRPATMEFLVYLVGGGMATVVAEKFSKNGGN